jgi:uncharacterized protein
VGRRTVIFARLPVAACWQHRGARSGFEVAYFEADPGGWRFDGTTAAIEDAQSWIVSYSVELDVAWRTRRARITARTAWGLREAELACDEGGVVLDYPGIAVRARLPVFRLIPGGLALI